MEVKCSWTLCKHCKDVRGIEGVCNHPNGTESMVKDGNLVLSAHNAMTKCKLYSGKS